MSKPLGRPRARGTVAQNRAGTWYAVISADTDPLTGERKRHWHRAEPNTRKAAEKLRTAKLRELDQQQYVDPSVKTLEEYLREWLDAHASQVRANTLYGYRKKVEGRVIPALGDIPLQQVTAPMIQRLYADMLHRDGLALATVKQVHAILVRAFEDANRWKMLTGNPAKDARAPKQHANAAPVAKGHQRAWTREELNTFLTGVRTWCDQPQANDPHGNKRDARQWFYPAFYLAVRTGMRPEEINGLRWEDVELDLGVLRVINCRTMAGPTVIEGPPKTKAGRRTIELSDNTVTVLREWQKEQADRGHSDGYVFTDLQGRPHYPLKLTQTFARLIKGTDSKPAAVQLPPRPTRRQLYDLRHTHCTLLLEAGVHHRTLSERMGHSSVSFTLDTYTEPTNGMQREAAQKMESILGG